jgi:4-amino-4-deoxy-L-arabinose transferase-like glycosyltransferase
MGSAELGRGESGLIPSLGRWFRLALVGLVLARGVVALCVIPPFEGWDEYQHVAYVTHVVERGCPAVFGKDVVPDSLLAAMIPAFPQSVFALQQLDSRLGALDYATYWSRRDADPALLRPCNPSAAGVRLPLYQAQHSWWYYALAAPLFVAMGGVQDLPNSVGGLRLVNVLLAAASVWVVLGVIARRVRSRRVASWIGLAIATQPLFLMNSARVSSDALGVFMSTVVVALAMRRDDHRATWRFGAMGVLAGLAILTKATNWYLVPLLAGSWLFTTIRHRTSATRALASGIAAALCVAMLVGPEIRYNLATYGVPTSMQEAILNHQHGRGPSDLWQIAGVFPWAGWVRWLWLQGALIRGGWSLLDPSAGISRVYCLAVVGGVLGWGWCLAGVVGRHLGVRLPGQPWGRENAEAGSIFDSAWTPLACLLLCTSVTATLGYHALQSMLCWGAGTTQSWYAATAFPWFQVLVIAGALAWPSRLGPPLAAVLVGSYVLSEQSMLWTKMLPTYSGGMAGWEALRRIAQLQPPFLATATLLAAQAVAGLLLIGLGVSIARRPWQELGPAAVAAAHAGQRFRPVRSKWTPETEALDRGVFVKALSQAQILERSDA